MTQYTVIGLIDATVAEECDAESSVINEETGEEEF